MTGRLAGWWFAGIGCIAGAFGTTVVKLDTRALVERATHVVEGEVLETHCARDVRGRIVTFVRLRVEADGWWKGRGERELTLRLPGGILHGEGRGLHVPGMPILNVGERSVLFVTDSGGLGEHAIVGLGQGRLRVVRDARSGAKRVVRELTGLEFVDERTGRPTQEPVPSLDVQDYEAFKRSVLQLVRAGEGR